MTEPLFFLIIDGYPKASRDELAQAGMTPAWKLYANHAAEAAARGRV